ncbi:hypothetical protein VOLCADRAFT_93981 [Volvox carteri f. nagariensis]|uniref:Uncharacterized protein n=1 Tax=Volvox carteri f. nagariensis TaxID=3068 RepID=D8U3L2_VOLCA|nr:uncharacterized protein VOLCADRAFT_93981 [Volvox carteri f. nagariensis]EFJ45628.1 hypothetical protein VOLCADRAFT_93981 [Volvox carteri f. nagariensis]|eukprot:XP_002953318.1 hypothetical protein VOLCADRAFT_93981 [Volvox carteri f. nagariensis]
MMCPVMQHLLCQLTPACSGALATAAVRPKWKERQHRALKSPVNVLLQSPAAATFDVVRRLFVVPLDEVQGTNICSTRAFARLYRALQTTWWSMVALSPEPFEDEYDDDEYEDGEFVDLDDEDLLGDVGEFEDDWEEADDDRDSMYDEDDAGGDGPEELGESEASELNLIQYAFK